MSRSPDYYYEKHNRDVLNNIRIVKAARALFDKLDNVHNDPKYYWVWIMYSPQSEYGNEFEELKLALNQ